MKTLNAGRVLVFFSTLPGKLAPPIFGPCGARLLRERLTEYAPVVEGTTGRESTGAARPSRAAQMIDGSIVRMGDRASSRLRTSVSCLEM
jgi:hypothetical protein